MGRDWIRPLAAPRSVARRAYGLVSWTRPAVERHPDRGDLADGRRAADDHVADGERDLGAGAAGHLLEHVGKLALVDQVERVAVLAERASGSRSAARAGRRQARDRRRDLGERARVEDRAGGLGRGALEGLRRAHDRRGALHQLPGEVAEEAAPGEVGAFGRGRAAAGVGSGVVGASGVGPVSSVNRGAPWSGPGSVLDDAGHPASIEPLAALEEVELDQEGEARRRRP